MFLVAVFFRWRMISWHVYIHQNSTMQTLKGMDTLAREVTSQKRLLPLATGVLSKRKQFIPIKQIISCLCRNLFRGAECSDQWPEVTHGSLHLQNDGKSAKYILFLITTWSFVANGYTVCEFLSRCAIVSFFFHLYTHHDSFRLKEQLRCIVPAEPSSLFGGLSDW